MAIGQESDDGPIEIEGPESQVIDDANYSHQRRLRAIHNARDRVIEVRNVVEEQLITGQLTEFRARQYYRGAVESLIMETMPVLESEQLSLSKDYLEGVHLGTVTISPPQWLVNHARENINRLAPGASVPSPVTKDVVGLRQIVEAPSPIGETFSVVTKRGKSGVDSERAIGKTELSRSMLDAAVREVSAALEEAEMGINIGEERPHNSLSSGNKKPWEDLLPHELLDAYEEGVVDKETIEQLREEQEGDDE